MQRVLARIEIRQCELDGPEDRLHRIGAGSVEGDGDVALGLEHTEEITHTLQEVGPAPAEPDRDADRFPDPQSVDFPHDGETLAR